jgi:cytochrome c biogenesis protein CcdA
MAITTTKLLSIGFYILAVILLFISAGKHYAKGGDEEKVSEKEGRLKGSNMILGLSVVFVIVSFGLSVNSRENKLNDYLLISAFALLVILIFMSIKQDWGFGSKTLIGLILILVAGHYNDYLKS